METQCVYHEVTTKLPLFSRLVAILSEQWATFDLNAVHVRFVLYKMPLRQVSLPVLRFSPAIIIPPRPRIYLLISTNGCILVTVEQR